MKRARGQVGGRAVAGFLLLEPAFPRSIRYCLRAAHSRFRVLRPPDRTELPGTETARRLGMQRSHLYKKIEKHGLSRDGG